MNAGEVNLCWRCGADIAAELLPLRREEVCVACNADLHVCKQCQFYNPAVADACEEPIALDVSNKERANFCDYFKPSPRAYRGVGSAAEQRARAELDALFGGAAPGAGSNGAASELEQLFGLDDNGNQ